jgi:hypothetical protein
MISHRQIAEDAHRRNGVSESDFGSQAARPAFSPDTRSVDFNVRLGKRRSKLVQAKLSGHEAGCGRLLQL